MVTELMIILIAVGAVIIIGVGISSRRRKRREQDQKDVEESTEKFKRDLEKTANEIIGRMEGQAAHLENLLDDSERSRTQLEGRVAELRKLLKKTEGQSTEIKDLLARLDDAVDDVDNMQKQMDAVERQISAVMQAQQRSAPQIPAPNLNALKANIQPPQATLQPRVPVKATVTPPTQTESANTFSKVLEKSIAEKVSAATPAVQRKSIVLGSNKPATVAQSEPVNIETIRKNLLQRAAAKPAQSPPKPTGALEMQAKLLAERKARLQAQQQSQPEIKTPATVKAPATPAQTTKDLVPTAKAPAAKVTPPNNNKREIGKAEVVTDSLSIRDMLLSGMSVEEVARETGLGRGAIELVQQMILHQLDKR